MNVHWWVWALFAFLVLAMLAPDLAAGRQLRGSPRVLSVRSAAAWRAAWISLGLLFGVLVLALFGTGPALTYLSTCWTGSSG
jgi:tellurite resistance protein TerC